MELSLTAAEALASGGALCFERREVAGCSHFTRRQEGLRHSVCGPACLHRSASADVAQASANQAGQAAVAAGAVALTDAQAVALVNKRVSDLADYKTVVEADLFFPTGQDTLSPDDKAVLSKLASDAAAIQNYMIEIAGYASSTGTRAENLKLSDDRAAVVANYPRDSANVPMRRILVPAGYGASHPAVSNQTAEGRDINQRVDVKVIVNKGIEESASLSQ